MRRFVRKALLVPCLVLAGCSPGASADDADRRAILWTNALAVSRPDYRVVHEENRLAQGEHDEAVRVVVEPRWPRPSPTEVFGRQDLEIRTAPDGSAVVPRLRDWRLGEVIREVGQVPDPAETTRRARGALDKLTKAGELRVALVVGFVAPMSEREALQISAAHPEVVFLSPLRADGGLPMSWDHSPFCGSRGFDDCDPAARGSLTSGFRRWVGLLKAEDADVLTPFGLGLAELKERAAEGLWHGAIYNVWPERAREIVEDPRVGVAAVGQAVLQRVDGGRPE